LSELAQERAARETHFALLRSPLVADLLHPDTAIVAEDLAPTLLTASREDLEATLPLFDAAQLQALAADAEQCLARLADRAPSEAADRLARIRAAAFPGDGAAPVG
jgi:hypothetical protein